MDIFPILRQVSNLIPFDGDAVKLGNVTFEHLEGEFCFDIPSTRWDLEAVLKDLIDALRKLKQRQEPE